MPERLEPSGKRGDFVGWTGLGPIALLIENVLGFRADGAHNRLEWRLARNDPHGIRRLRFGAITADVIYDGNETVSVKADAPFTLVINGVPHEITTGESTLKALPNLTPPKTPE
jgi:hypothetical protein